MMLLIYLWGTLLVCKTTLNAIFMRNRKPVAQREIMNKGWDKGVAGGGARGSLPPSQFILDKNKDLGNYNKYLPLRDCVLAGLCSFKKFPGKHAPRTPLNLFLLLNLFQISSAEKKNALEKCGNYALLF